MFIEGTMEFEDGATMEFIELDLRACVSCAVVLSNGDVTGLEDQEAEKVLEAVEGFPYAAHVERLEQDDFNCEVCGYRGFDEYSHTYTYKVPAAQQ